MFRTGFFVFRVLAGLVLIAALVAGGFGIFRAGQAQGYALGAAAASAGAVNPPAQLAPLQPAPLYPAMPYAWPGYYGPHFSPFGWIFGPLFFIGMIIFVFFILGGLFRMGRGMRHAHEWKEHAQDWQEFSEWAKQRREQRQAGQPQGPIAPPAAS